MSANPEPKLPQTAYSDGWIGSFGIIFKFKVEQIEGDKAMSIQQQDVEKTLESSGFERIHETKKVVGYRSERNGKIVYFRTEIGLPKYVRIVAHPSEEVSSLVAVAGVQVNSPKEFQHGSNMIAFPKKTNGGQSEIHYGRALNIKSLSALADFAVTFHKL